MTTTTSRRAILAGAAALATVPAIPAVASHVPDPIFELIEAHKLTFLRRMETSSILMKSSSSAPDYALVDAADNEARDADEAAAYELVNVQPTTMAGVFALIGYVDDFNRGKFGINDEWRSAPYNWPSAETFDFEFEEVVDYDGDCGMAFAVLLNVRDALEAMAVQS